MPKILSDEAVRAYHRDGYYAPVRVMSEADAAALRGRLEAFEASSGGPLKGHLPAHPRIRVHGFVQPEALGALYRSARIFALPSRREAWGLVVHEAALSGCQLLLSDAIGARWDFASPDLNAVVVPVGDRTALAAALLHLTGDDAAALERAQAASLRRARTHGPAVFADRVSAIVRKLS